MIEFAPNPTGPAHIGTLRTYALGWKTAKKLGLKMNVRFDANDVHKVRGAQPGYRRKYAESFLAELEALDMSPDCWTWFTEEIRTETLPGFLEIREIDNPTWDKIAVCPWWKPQEVIAGNADWWGEDKPIPLWKREQLEFAYHDKSLNKWIILPPITSTIHCALRGVTHIVRSLVSGHLRVCEKAWMEKLHFPLPEEIMTGVVVTEGGALSKHLLQPGDVGTVGYWMEELGPAELRDRVLASVDLGREIVSLNEIVGYRVEGTC